MGILDANTTQFVVDAVRSMNSPALDLTMESKRRKISTNDDVHTNGHRHIRNNDGTGMTYAQIAAAANLTVAQVQDIAGRI